MPQQASRYSGRPLRPTDDTSGQPRVLERNLYEYGQVRVVYTTQTVGVTKNDHGTTTSGVMSFIFQGLSLVRCRPSMLSEARSKMGDSHSSRKRA